MNDMVRATGQRGSRRSSLRFGVVPGRLSPNALGSLYMALGAAAIVVNDGLIRLSVEEGLDVYQALFLRGCAMIAVFAVAGRLRNERVDRHALRPPVVLRLVAEVVGTVAFFAALIHLEFANAQTILMLVPFVVTVVAARALGEKVSLGRFLVVAAGFGGVILVVRPTPASFSPWTLVAVGCAAAIVVREFATRRIDPGTPPLTIALLTAVAITSTMGLISLFTGWGELTGRSITYLALATGFLVAGYLFAIQTVRVGDLSVSAPFRYTSVVGAVLVGRVMFDESPDLSTLLGCALIIAAGVETARQEAHSRPRSLVTQHD